MKLEDQVCSLELAKRLKELGVKQESLFYWTTSPWNGQNQVIYYEDRNQLKDDFIDNRYNLVSAFTVAELGELLKDADINMLYKDGQWKLGMRLKMSFQGEDANEANARAEMLIYLLKNKLITP